MFVSAASYIEESPPLPTHPLLQTEWKDNFYEAPLTDTEERVCDILIEGLQHFIERASNKRWRNLSEAEKTAHIHSILARPQVEQRTAEWYLQAQRVLTASEFSSVYSSERQYANLVLAKALPPAPRSKPRLACLTQEMSPFDWGIRFEPLVKQLFERRWSVKIVDSGRLVHPNDTHLAASPDGLILEGGVRTGRLIEIKCPISREIGGNIPFDYWCQMQIQMEVTNIDECEYLEVKFDSPHPKNMKYVPNNPLEEGSLWVLKRVVQTESQTEGPSEYTYAYSEEERISKEQEGWSLEETVPWALSSYHTLTLQRDSSWFADTSGIREKFWQDVAKARDGNFKIPEPSAPRAKPCLIR